MAKVAASGRCHVCPCGPAPLLSCLLARRAPSILTLASFVCAAHPAITLLPFRFFPFHISHLYVPLLFFERTCSRCLRSDFLTTSWLPSPPFSFTPPPPPHAHMRTHTRSIVSLLFVMSLSAPGSSLRAVLGPRPTLVPPYFKKMLSAPSGGSPVNYLRPPRGDIWKASCRRFEVCSVVCNCAEGAG